MMDVSPFVESLKDKPVAVFGLARSGLSTIKALKAAGADAIAWDDRAEARAAAKELGADIQELSTDILQTCACLVLAPGVPYTFKPHAVVLAAQEAGIEILCDIEIFHRSAHGGKVIGITGTNGKSTTTALMDHVLKACGKSSEMGGNIGKPALEMKRADFYVLELSSYQLDLCPTFKPDIAVLLNITPDHIDRHGTMAAYEEAKRRIFGGDDQVKIEFPEIDDRVRICVNMKGDHNLQNASAVLLACEALGLSVDAVLAAIKTFPGLAHRQFLVRKIGDVSFVNDSKATNAEAASKALSSYDDIYWIVGGQAKEGGLGGLESYMSRVRHAFVIGEAAPEFSKWLAAQSVAHTMSETLERAVRSAHKMAAAGTVLLAPACASWDQFKDFEDRGHQFEEIVRGL